MNAEESVGALHQPAPKLDRAQQRSLALSLERVSHCSINSRDYQSCFYRFLPPPPLLQPGGWVVALRGPIRIAVLLGRVLDRLEPCLFPAAAAEAAIEAGYTQFQVPPAGFGVHDKQWKWALHLGIQRMTFTSIFHSMPALVTPLHKSAYAYITQCSYFQHF